jgi:hypothetical protein
MNLIKYGIASVVVACAAVAACSGSSTSGSGSGAGTSNSSAGTSNGSGGTSSSSGGSSSSSGGSSTSSGGTSCNPMMQGSSCPAETNCLESKCKTQLDACAAATGPCADFAKCATPCNCDQACVSRCTQSPACKTCANGIVNCGLSMCLNEALSCNTGSGGTGSGGSFGFGGNAGTFPSFDAGTATCADLAKCCAKLPSQEQMACTQIVSGGIDAICSISLSSLCPS